MRERRAPSPKELRQQLFGAAVALGWVSRMMEEHPEHWRDEGLSTCKSLYKALLKERNDNVHGEALWKVLQSMRPDDITNLTGRLGP